MLKILRITAVFAILSVTVGCSIDDGANGYNFTYKLAPVTAVDIPDTVVYNEQYHFDISFEQPTDCYKFSGFDFNRDGHERTVGVVNTVRESQSCERYEDQHIVTKSLNFLVKRDDYYQFKFWTGTDSVGDAEYLEKRVYVKSDE